MFELRWVRPPTTTTEPDKLQYRVHLPVIDIGGHLCPGDWTEWQDVPVHIAQKEGNGND